MQLQSLAFALPHLCSEKLDNKQITCLENQFASFETHKHSRTCFNLLVSCTTDPRISKICVIRYAPQSIGICTSQSFVLRNLLGLVSINIAVFSPSFYWKLLIETKNAAHSEEKLVSGNKSFRIVNPKCCVKLSLPVYSRG